MALESTPDGDELVAAHLTEYQKTRNIRRDPRVAVTVLAARKPGQQTPYVAITGTARIVEGGAPALLKKLAKVMLGSDEHFPPPNAPEGLRSTVIVQRPSTSCASPPILLNWRCARCNPWGHRST